MQYNYSEQNKIIGSIEKTGKYNTTVLSCEYFHSEFSFELNYKNPNSYLSYNVQNTLITNPIITIISIRKKINQMKNHIFNYIENYFNIYL